MRMQNLQPIFSFEGAYYIQRIVFVGQLCDFMADGAACDVIDVFTLFRSVISLLSAFFERPVKAGSEAGGTNQARRIFDERIVMQNSQQLRFYVGYAVERIKQQSTRSLIQRERHGVHGEIAATQILLNTGGSYDRRLADLFIGFGVSHSNFCTHVSWQNEK